MEDVLESDALTIDDDFFEKGGDLLLATGMISEVERRLGISIHRFTAVRGIHN